MSDQKEAHQNCFVDRNVNDVIKGRGFKIAFSPGNKQYTSIVGSFKAACALANKRGEKDHYARLVFEKVRDMNPPGRFLDLDKESNKWKVMSEKDALLKIRQALREGAPKIRESVRGDAGSLSAALPSLPLPHKTEFYPDPVPCFHSAARNDHAGTYSNPKEFINRVIGSHTINHGEEDVISTGPDGLSGRPHLLAVSDNGGGGNSSSRISDSKQAYPSLRDNSKSVHNPIHVLKSVGSESHAISMPSFDDSGDDMSLTDWDPECIRNMF